MISVSLYNDRWSLIHVSYFTKKDGSTCLQTNGVEMEKMRGEAELFLDSTMSTLSCSCGIWIQPINQSQMKDIVVASKDKMVVQIKRLLLPSMHSLGFVRGWPQVPTEEDKSSQHVHAHTINDVTKNWSKMQLIMLLKILIGWSFGKKKIMIFISITLSFMCKSD